MANFEAIHFDMDGVIADTDSLHVAAEKQTCAEFGLEVSPDAWLKLKGKTIEDVFEGLVTGYGDSFKHNTQEMITRKTEIFLEKARQGIVPIEGALEFLGWARDTYSKISLVTSADKVVQTLITQALGIEDMFDTVVTGDDVEEGKPSPVPYLIAANNLGVRPSASMVIEDAVSGIHSALAAGCGVLALASSHPAEVLRSKGPDYVADDYADAKRWLLTL